jgi:hypothetical protein
MRRVEWRKEIIIRELLAAPNVPSREITFGGMPQTVDWQFTFRS